jgi:hypothetical protein
MTNQGVNFQLPLGGQFSVAVDTAREIRLLRRSRTLHGVPCSAVRELLQSAKAACSS